jgi:hypothetical protein
VSNDEQSSGCHARSWDDEMLAIQESIDQGDFKMATIKMAVLQITPTYFTIGMVSGDRYWMSGDYSTHRSAKRAITRKLFRSGGEEYEQVTFDEYQSAIRELEKN